MTAQLALDLDPRPRTRPLSELQQAVLDLIKARPRTDEQLADEFPFKAPGTICRRRGELVDLGLVKDSGEKRQTRSLCDATVWQAS